MQITLYSTDCPKCKVLKQKLNQKQIAYNECNDVKIMQKMGFVSAPVLVVDKEIMDFNSAIKWVMSK